MRIGRYDIIEELGRGAMGVVYKASDPLIGRIVAIKIILTTGLDSVQLTDYKRRFFREAQLAGRVSHPGIVTIYDIEEDEHGQPYLVMEFVEGITLQGMLCPAHSGHLPGRLPLDRALNLASQTAEALDYAHRSGVVHSDVKPANILVTPEGRVRVADFGIARFTGTETPHTVVAVMGTPAYMAPEQLSGGKVDPRSDVFSVGAMLYWMVTGQKAFPGEDLASVSFKVVYTDPPRPSEIDPDLPPDFDTVIFRCLAKNRADRYPTARSLALDLQCIAAGEPISATLGPPLGGWEETVTATLPLTVGWPPVTATKVRRTTTSERPLNKWLVTAAILALTFAVIAIVARPVERILLISPPAPVLAEEAEKPTEAKVDSDVTSQAKAESPIVVSAVDLTPKRFAGAVKPAVKPPAANSTLLFECSHSFRNAILSISSDGKDLDMTVLEKKGIWFASSGGKVENQTPLELPAGPHQVRVRVRSNDEKKPFDQEASIDGTFPEMGSLRLKIDFPKDQLRLRWAGE